MISMQFGLAATASLNWLIMVSGAQAENCSLQLDAERRGGLRGAGLAGERRAVAGVAAHLHVHDEARAGRILRERRAGAEQQRGGRRADQQCFDNRHVMFLPCHLAAPPSARRTARSSGRRMVGRTPFAGAQKRAKKAAPPLRLVDKR